MAMEMVKSAVRGAKVLVSLHASAREAITGETAISQVFGRVKASQERISPGFSGAVRVILCLKGVFHHRTGRECTVHVVKLFSRSRCNRYRHALIFAGSRPSDGNVFFVEVFEV